MDVTCERTVGSWVFPGLAKQMLRHSMVVLKERISN